MMKHTYISYLAALITAMSFSGCSDEIGLPASGENGKLAEYYFVVGQPSLSRAISYESDEHSEFNGGELLGCFALDASGNVVDKPNACYTVGIVSSPGTDADGAKVLLPNTPSDKINKGHAGYLFYYPYDENIKTLDEVKRLTHSVRADQSDHRDYEASDLLWDVAIPSGNVCHVNMDHAMANIIIVIDGVEYDAEKGADVLSQPLTASGVNLTAPDIEAMREIGGAYHYSVDPGQNTHDIKALYTRYSMTNDRFRAAVPANRTLEKGSEIIRLWSKETGAEKTFSLKNDILLEPGKNYVFTLIKAGKPQIEVTDDDSWVLDVLDPETGKVVGLLCREYLHYQPGHTITDTDLPTVPAGETGKPRINSQAWVFYNLQDDGETPDLSIGQVLRFVYDVRINTHAHKDDPIAGNTDHGGTGNGNGGLAWPYPHIYHSTGWTDGAGDQGFGIFLADHSCVWQADENRRYGISGKSLGEYYMHGGFVLWDGINNQINEFIMPQKDMSATNEAAREFGHIAIPKDGNVPYVSFAPINENGHEDAQGQKVGFVLPHCLIDSRIDINGNIQTIRYPLVKIGYNQFWISKSLNARTFTDGTPLECFNTKENQRGQANTKAQTYDYWDAPSIPPGYLYPIFTTLNSTDFGEDDKWFDPYKEEDGNEDILESKGKYEMVKLYNFYAVLDDRILPKSAESISEYKRPKYSDYMSMLGYLGFYSIPKLMSNQIQARDDFKKTESNVDAFCKGKYLIDHDLNTFTANVSGFNLKAYSWANRGAFGGQMSLEGGFFLMPDNSYKDGITMPLYHSYDCWSIDPDNANAYAYGNKYMYKYEPGGVMPNAGVMQYEHYQGLVFGQIRLFLSFRKNDNRIGVMTKSGGKTRMPESCAGNNVYVAVE